MPAPPPPLDDPEFFLTTTWTALEEHVLAYERDAAQGKAQSFEAYLPSRDAPLRKAVWSELQKVARELHEARRFPRPEALLSLEAGQTLGDFELLSLLGEGAFARIFRARQLSLNREVAVKVSASPSGEAQTLARLDHDNIVRVYSETADPQRNLRVLCMQYVPGTTLARILERLRRTERINRSGEMILEAAEQLSDAAVLFDREALHDWEQLQGADLVEAAAWIGQRLAEALAAAHAQGVLHCDIKPANVLVTPYGRPLLTDFNLSIRRQGALDAEGIIGGTLAYMAPEHLEAFRVADPSVCAKIDARADLYSLGVVLFEMLAGERPFPVFAGRLEETAAMRRQPPPFPRSRNPDVSVAMEQAIRRALDPDPERRFASAREMAAALRGVRQLRRIEKQLPRAGGLAAGMGRHPFLWLEMAAAVPHLLAAMVLVVYQCSQVAPRLTPPEQSAWLSLIGGYSAVGMIVAIIACTLRHARVRRDARRLETDEDHAGRQAADLRRRVASLARCGITIAGVAWLVGALVVLGGLEALGGEIDFAAAVHVGASFVLSGLIAMTYSYLGEEFIAVRVLYPRMWSAPRRPRELARRELRCVGPRLRLFQISAGAIPLAGAAMIVIGDPTTAPVGARELQLLAAALMVLGMTGFGAAIIVGNWISKTLQALTGD
jgi:eukaryotic-like serine/threonine-protein kinase